MAGVVNNIAIDVGARNIATADGIVTEANSNVCLRYGIVVNIYKIAIAYSNGLGIVFPPVSPLA